MDLIDLEEALEQLDALAKSHEEVMTRYSILQDLMKCEAFIAEIRRTESLADAEIESMRAAAQKRDAMMAQIIN